jgi:hypothetical protein
VKRVRPITLQGTWHRPMLVRTKEEDDEMKGGLGGLQGPVGPVFFSSLFF